MLKQRRTEALLAPLASAIGGIVSDCRVRGSYQGYAVEAWARRARPGHPLFEANNPTGNVPQGPLVNIFGIKLAGVSGGRFWDCRSSPTTLSLAVPEVFTSLTYRLIRTEFKFERPLGGGLAKKFGVPPADEDVHERLRAAGLFEELSLLRWGRHPYLPQVSFNPGAQAMGVADLVSGMKERLRAAGHSELESALDEGLAQEDSGELMMEVELGRAKAPAEERFRELLDRAVRIVQINAEANPR